MAKRATVGVNRKEDNLRKVLPAILAILLFLVLLALPLSRAAFAQESEDESTNEQLAPDDASSDQQHVSDEGEDDQAVADEESETTSTESAEDEAATSDNTDQPAADADSPAAVESDQPATAVDPAPAVPANVPSASDQPTPAAPVDDTTTYSPEDPAEDLDRRVNGEIAMIDRRFVALDNAPSPMTRLELLSGVNKLLEQAINDIDDRANKTAPKVFAKAVNDLARSCEGYIPKLNAALDKATDEKEKGANRLANDQCGQVLEARKKVPQVP